MNDVLQLWLSDGSLVTIQDSTTQSTINGLRISELEKQVVATRLEAVAAMLRSSLYVDPMLLQAQSFGKDHDS